MPEPTAPAPSASYLEHRARLNARWRCMYAAPLLCVSAAITLAHVLSGSFERNGILAALEGYALVFAYLAGVAVLGLAGGRRPPACGPRLGSLLDRGWIALLMPGAAGLATLDARMGDLTGYAMICLPAAIFHSAPRLATVALQFLAFAAAAAGIALASKLDATASFMFLLTLGACTAVFSLIGLQFESSRRRAFDAARELEQRSAALLEANAQLETNNRKLELRTAELARLNADLEEHSAALEHANSLLEELAGTDPLTGVANRRQLYEAIDREYGRARRFGNALAMAVIDLDNFGQINKRHGVIAGDEVLAEFAAELRAQVRGVDVVARYGGEEFVVVMPDCTAPAAAQLIERVRASVARAPLGSRRIAISFTAGVCALAPDDTDPLTVLHRADEALRGAKSDGKNRVALG